MEVIKAKELKQFIIRQFYAGKFNKYTRWEIEDYIRENVIELSEVIKEINEVLE